MHIGCVVVIVLDSVMPMHVRVLADEQRLVRMRMMTCFVPMHVLVLDRFVHVTMAMVLADVQIDAEAKQPRRSEAERSGMPIAQRPCQCRADERRQREHGP